MKNIIKLFFFAKNKSLFISKFNMTNNYFKGDDLYFFVFRLNN